jgi:hypothetical protein
MGDIVCRLCGKNATECPGFLKRVNPTGEDGIWECRPACDAAPQTNEARVLGAIEDKS